MKSIKVTFLLIVFTCVAPWNLSIAQERETPSWYFGFGIGIDLGGVKFEGDSIEDYYRENHKLTEIDNSPHSIILKMGLGSVITKSLHIGFDLSVLRQDVDYKYTSVEAETRIEIQSYFASLSYYPFGKGFFVKSGAGLCKFNYEENGYGNDSYIYNGKGYLLGLGCDMPLGEYLKLRIHTEYTKHFWDDSEAPNNTEYVGIYISLFFY